MEPFSTAAPDDSDPEDDQMRAWFDQAVYYEDMLVTRSTAYQLCAEATKCWFELDRITDLPPASEMALRQLPILSAAEAYQKVCSRTLAYSNNSRDI